MDGGSLAFINWVVMGVVGWLFATNTLLYFFQDALLFPAPPLYPEVRSAIAQAYPGTELSITMPDGVVLHGWYLKSPPTDGQPAPVILYFGGNGEEVSWMIDNARNLKGYSILLINYRGYGASGGKPSEKSLFSDAEFLYDMLLAYPDTDRDKIFIVGRSLGTGVGVHLAAKRKIAGMVLISPYDSITRVAGGHYPYALVSWLNRHPFDAIALAGDIRVPVLALVAEHDKVIPPSHSRALLERWAGPKDLVVVSGVDHNSILRRGQVWRRIKGFLDQTLDGTER